MLGILPTPLFFFKLKKTALCTILNTWPPLTTIFLLNWCLNRVARHTTSWYVKHNGSSFCIIFSTSPSKKMCHLHLDKKHKSATWLAMQYFLLTISFLLVFADMKSLIFEHFAWKLGITSSITAAIWFLSGFLNTTTFCKNPAETRKWFLIWKNHVTMSKKGKNLLVRKNHVTMTNKKKFPIMQLSPDTERNRHVKRSV